MSKYNILVEYVEEDDEYWSDIEYEIEAESFEEAVDLAKDYTREDFDIRDYDLDIKVSMEHSYKIKEEQETVTDTIIKEVKAFEIEGKLFETREKALEFFKQKQVENIARKIINNIIDYSGRIDTEYAIKKLAEELVKRQDEVKTVLN